MGAGAVTSTNPVTCLLYRLMQEKTVEEVESLIQECKQTGDLYRFHDEVRANKAKQLARLLLQGALPNAF